MAEGGEMELKELVFAAVAKATGRQVEDVNENTPVDNVEAVMDCLTPLVDA